MVDKAFDLLKASATGTVVEQASSTLLSRNVEALRRTRKLQRTYLFDFMISADIGGIPGSEVSQHIQSVHVPDYQMVQSEAMRYGAFKRGYAGFFDIKDITVEFLVPAPDIVGRFLMEWRRLMVDTAGRRYPKNNYARGALLTRYDRDGTRNGVFRAYGVFPKTFPEFDHSYSKEEVATYTIDFNVDKLIQED